MSQDLKIADFKTTLKGRSTDLYFLENQNNLRAAITNYGARIVALWVPDAHGISDTVVAGYSSIKDYLEREELYLGATVGRFANRINNARFSLNGEPYDLSANEGDNQLHGGEGGLHQKIWSAEQKRANTLKLHCHSEDGEEGYPGNLDIEVTYTLTEQNELLIEYSARSDRDTILNMTNHAYFNLGGESRKVHARNHELKINADYYLPVDGEQIPTGELANVGGTPFDFRELRTVNEQLSKPHPQLNKNEGFDHHYALNKDSGKELTLAAKVIEPSSGRAMETKTTEPGLQFFECAFPSGTGLEIQTAFCLETQHFPDSPNQPAFPTTLLKAGEQFTSTTTYRFFTVG